MQPSSRSIPAAVLVLALTVLACSRTAVPTSAPVEPAATLPPDNPCFNLLYPFSPGSQWIYDLRGGADDETSRLGLTVARVEGSRAVIDALDLSTGIVTQTVAECQQGAILNFPALTMRMLIGNGLSSDFRLDYVSGQIAPAREAFEQADWLLRWETEMLANGNVLLSEEGETVEVTLQDTPVRLSWQTAGSGDQAFEAVTVPAGTFERALKVQREVVFNISLVYEDVLLENAELSIQTTQWFAPDIGLLRSVVDSGRVTYLSTSFPLELQGSLELVEFTAGR